MRRLSSVEERWPLRTPFVIARGAKTEARVIVVTIEEAGRTGRGEATPYARYGETVEACLATIEAIRDAVEAGADRRTLGALLPPGAARNALDCALWDLEAKIAGVRAWDIAGSPPPVSVETAFTLSLDAPAAMAAAARRSADRALLKLKIGGADDVDRVSAVHAAAPRSALIVDANEALSFDELHRLAPDFRRLGVLLIEQPLPADQDGDLEGYVSPVPLCADESAHTRADLDQIVGRYDALNIKLDKTGGLTEALALGTEARQRGLDVMVGCMVATSLAMAPALLLTGAARVVDLDGPLLLEADRAGGLVYAGSRVEPPTTALWG